jgi:hypothetical protein
VTAFLNSTGLTWKFNYKLTFVLYWCKIWSPTVREEHRLRILVKRVLRRIFRPKREKVEGGWRRLQNEELRYLYASKNIIRVIKSRRIRWTGHLARTGEVRNI